MHRFLWPIVAALLFLVAGCGHHEDDVVLPQLKGEYRVIAVFADNSQQENSFTNAFKSAPGLARLDIAWFIVGPKQIHTNIDFIPERDRLNKLHTVDAFQAILLGKDGKLIASQLGGLDIQGLLNAIHPMPEELKKLQEFKHSQQS